jgi:tetratricopeptide (TPR) repeat protein
LDIYKKDYKEATTVELKAEALLKIAWVFERSGYLENARKTYDKCLKLGMDIRAFVKLGELQIRMGFIEEGIDNLEKATCILREDEEIKLKLAYGYSMLEMGLGKALAITNEILLKDPTNLRAIMLSSNIHQKMGNIDIALEISRAIDSSRNNESIKHYIGLLYLQKQEIQTAYTSFKEALRINPRYVPALVESASILSTDSPEAAVRIF